MKTHNNLTVYAQLALAIFIFSLGLTSIGLTNSDFEASPPDIRWN